MTSLVHESKKTWAGIGNVIWHGTMPGGDMAFTLAKLTGFSVEEILAASKEASDLRADRAKSEAA